MRAVFIALALFALPATAQDRLNVYTVTYPLAWMAEEIGGDLVDVTFPVPQDVDPAFWRPNIATIAAFQQADLILLNGAGFADWTAKASLPRRAVIDTSVAIADQFIETEAVTHSHGDDDPHSHTATATFLWLDPAMAQAQAQAVYQALTRRAPQETAQFDAGLADVTATLDALAEQARTLGTLYPQTRLLASHPRYQYLARAVGVEIDAVSWASNEVPDAEQLAELSVLNADGAARIMLWESTPPAAAIAALEQQGLMSVTFPTLANRPVSGDFGAEMSAALTRLTTALATE